MQVGRRTTISALDGIGPFIREPFSVIHRGITDGFTDSLGRIDLSKQQRVFDSIDTASLEMFSLKDEDGETLLTLALQRGVNQPHQHKDEIVSRIIRRCRTEARLDLLAFPNEKGETALHLSASSHHVENNRSEMFRLLVAAQSPEQISGQLDLFGSTIVHIAAYRLPVTELEILLQKCPDGRLVKDIQGSLPLHCAATRSSTANEGGEAILLLLRDYRQTLNMGNRTGDTPLIRAAYNENFNMFKALLTEGADPFICNLSGECAYSIALTTQRAYESGLARDGGQEMIDLILENYHRFSRENLYGHTSAVLSFQIQLWYRPFSVEGRSNSIFGRLLQDDSDIKNLSFVLGRHPNKARKWKHESFPHPTALHCAVASGSHEVVRLLLTFSCNPHARDRNGNTPISLAREKGEKMYKIFEPYLKECKPETIFKLEGKTLEDYLEKIPAEQFCFLDPDFERTLLHNAILRHRLEVAKKLIQSIVSKNFKDGLNIKDGQGWTPLHYAVDTGQVKIAQLLLAAGASPDIADKDENTPLSLSLKQGGRMSEIFETTL